MLLVACRHLSLRWVAVVQLIRVVLIDQIFFFIVILVLLRNIQVDLVAVLRIVRASRRILYPVLLKLSLLIRAILLLILIVLVLMLLLLEILLHLLLLLLLLLLHSHLLSLSCSLLLKRSRILHLLADTSVKKS